MKVKWHGTACVSFETETSSIIIDPYIPRFGSETPSAEEEFLKYDNILISHGHFDHLSTIPETVAKSGATVWCTKTPHQTLLGKGVPAENVRVITPGDVLKFGDITVTVFQSHHVTFDAKLVLRTTFNKRVIKYFSNLVELIGENRVCKENGEIVAYLVEGDGKRVFILASMSWVDSIEYPKDVDLLILPFQGSSDLVTPGLEFVELTKPRAVMLDHFDDSFPPMSSSVETKGMAKALEGKLPLTIPEFEKDYEI